MRDDGHGPASLRWFGHEQGNAVYSFSRASLRALTGRCGVVLPDLRSRYAHREDAEAGQKGTKELLTHGIADRLAGDGRAAAGEVRRRPVGPAQAGLDSATRHGRTSGPAASGGWWRWLDMGCASMWEPRNTRCLDVDTGAWIKEPRVGEAKVARLLEQGDA